MSAKPRRRRAMSKVAAVESWRLSIYKISSWGTVKWRTKRLLSHSVCIFWTSFRTGSACRRLLYYRWSSSSGTATMQEANEDFTVVQLSERSRLMFCSISSCRHHQKRHFVCRANCANLQAKRSFASSQKCISNIALEHCCKRASGTWFRVPGDVCAQLRRCSSTPFRTNNLAQWEASLLGSHV